MVALAADRITTGYLVGELVRFPQGTGTTAFKGGMCMLNAAGFAVPAADTAGAKGVVGLFTKNSTAPSANGDKDVELFVGVARLVASSITDAMQGQNMYVVDDQTFDDALGTNGIKAGRLLRRISNTEGWIFIHPAFGQQGVIQADAGGTYTAAEQTLINQIKNRVNLYG
jgi:hypothetical protein